MTRSDEIGKGQMIAGALIGAVIGLGLFTFGYAKGAAYLTDDPAACANCHVMNDQYSSWLKGSHRAVAVCNDCHSPPGLLAKYATKAKNGAFHSIAFTTNVFPERIQIKAGNRAVAEQACQKCHEQITSAIQMTRTHGAGTPCLNCHARVGHM